MDTNKMIVDVEVSGGQQNRLSVDVFPSCSFVSLRGEVFVAIGRASQPFPRPKPDVQLSSHPAFGKEGFI